MNLRKVLVSWDFGAAVALLAATAAFAPARVPNVLVKDFYGAAIAVLSILFSVFFAALAIIMSSSDDDFVAFLEEEKGYTRIVSTFRFTLILLFMALLTALFLYVYTSVRLQAKVEYQSRWWSLIFGPLFLYALVAAFLASLDSVSYAKHRSRFISIRRRAVGIQGGRPNCPTPRGTP
jgi:hypothetical protein